MITSKSTCSHCGAEMTLVFKNKRRKYVCETCDKGDPLKSLKVGKLLEAVKPPQE